MNIAFLGRQWLPHTFERINGLKANGHNVYFFSWPMEKNINHKNLYLLPFPFSLKLINLIRYFIPNVLYIRKIIRKYNIQVLHIMGIVNGIYALFLFPAKVIIEHNGSDILLLPQKYWYYKLYYKLIYPFCSGIIQDSDVSKQAGIKIGAPTKNNEIIDIGVDFNYFNPNIKKGFVRKKYNIGKNQKIVFHARGSRELYNSDIILKSIPNVKKVFPDVIYFFAGYYDENNPYQKIVKKLNVQKNVIFLGKIDRLRMLPKYYIDSNLVISIPSSDSSPLSVYETMACMTPIILSKLPWLDLKFSNHDYMSVEPRDSISLSKKTIEALTSPNLRNAEKLYNVVLKDINSVRETKKLEKFYFNLI